MTGRLLALVVGVFALAGGTASAQSFNGDARDIAMGGAQSGNIATDMVEKERGYSSIVLPFGAIQAIQNLDRFRPDNTAFDPIFVMEYAASPLHYIVGRVPQDSPAARLVNDVRNGTFNRNLAAYQGFTPAQSLVAEGLLAPSWGGTIKVRRGPSNTYHGIYIGAGPYFATHTDNSIDPQLLDVLASGNLVANTTFGIANATNGQMALAITGGYRGRFLLPGSKANSRDGLYVAANYNYLRGFLYEQEALTLRFNTDAQGLVTMAPTTVPLEIDRTSATSGTGRAIDLGASIVLRQWEAGFGIRGLANQIEWTDPQPYHYVLNSLFEGGDFVQQSLAPVTNSVTTKLPVTYSGNVGYIEELWGVRASVAHGFQGWSVHAGGERRINRFELRGGLQYVREKWNPTGGIGLNLSSRLSIDVAAFSSTANIDNERRLGLAVSLRLNHR